MRPHPGKVLTYPQNFWEHYLYLLGFTAQAYLLINFISQDSIFYSRNVEVQVAKQAHIYQPDLEQTFFYPHDTDRICLGLSD